MVDSDREVVRRGKVTCLCMCTLYPLVACVKRQAARLPRSPKMHAKIGKPILKCLYVHSSVSIKTLPTFLAFTVQETL